MTYDAADWTDGYMADINYTHGYYAELHPLRARLAFLYAGLVPPSLGTHCELGFGQGLSVNIHAAASASTWHGCDFNPAQASLAQSLAQASGADAHLTDQAFADFCTRSDLPDFDSIGLHGIWSWVSDQNRAVIVDFVRRKLKVGGVLYNSYNTQPGWAAMVPMRDLLSEHAQVIGSAGQGVGSRIEEALAFADKLLATNPHFAQANPQIADRLNKIKEHDLHYVAHEYFNRDWLPMSFSRMAQWLSPAKLNFACSAVYTDHVAPLNLTADQIALMVSIKDPIFRQTVRDFMVNQAFRKDYWVKGERKLGQLEREDALRAQKVMLLRKRADVPLRIAGPIGEVGMQAAVFNPILDVLSDHAPKTIGQIEDIIKKQGVLFAQLTEAVMILTGAGSLAAVQDDEQISVAQTHTSRLNALLINKARDSDSIHFLASPVTGGGIAMNRIQQLFLLARQKGLTQPAEWAHEIWQTLQAQGQKLTHEGKTLESAEENIAVLTKQAREFMEAHLPILQALKIA
ncbi:MAG: methyltransferase [Rhodocyclaceae bacterium]|nr:MAG: methyltransferase [Rhodocyclaceae bacterium]